jgi:hypothetical protein
MRKQKTQQKLDAIVDALYWERDSGKYLRLMNSLAPKERKEVLKMLDERREATEAPLRKLFGKAVGKKLSK